MRLLLDTHIWLWSLLEPARLTRRVSRALTNDRNELWLSPISSWEFLVLVDKGRIALKVDPSDWLIEVMKRAPMREAPITHEIARETRKLDLLHEDPADRFLAATAKVLELTLVTADERLLASKSYAVLPNC